MTTKFNVFIAVILFTLQSFSVFAQQGFELEQSFLHPNKAAKPWVFWFWMNGNVTKEGITADLEAMQQAGIGGSVMMSIGFGTPAGKLDFNSPQWRDMYAHAVNESKRLGLEMSLHQSDGYATAGGRWIKPSQGIKEIVWTIKEVDGSSDTPISLVQPKTKLGFYEDVAVIAFPSDEKENIKPQKILMNGEEAGAMMDDNFIKGMKAGKKIEMEFAKNQGIRSIVFHLSKTNYVHFIEKIATIEISQDGKNFRKVASLNFNLDLNSLSDKTLRASFPVVLAKYFRINTKGMEGIEISEIELLAEPMVDLWEAKSAFARQRDHGGETSLLDAASYTAQQLPKDLVLNKKSVINLSDKLGKEGVLNWKAPAGKWKIIRVGMTATGMEILPQTRGGGGLEADKMNADAVRFHFDSFAKELISEHNKGTNKPIASVHVDSWESRNHNWSSFFRQEFENRCGYSMIPYLPTLVTGIVVGSQEESERFLWDVRRTMADLIEDNFYKVMLDKCHENGVLFQSESSGRQMFMYDPINYMSKSDIGIGEFWMKDEVRVDCRVAASVSHIYNQPIAGAESYTSEDGGYRDDLFAFKALGDKAFCTGINRFYIHCFVMQPWLNVEPGMSFGPFGINFGRTNTWWKNGAKVWTDYIARSSSLLQAGKFVGDVIHYIGDDAPNYLGNRNQIWNPVPVGYDYDGCNLDILKQLQVAKNGDLVLPHGMKYKVLLLPDRDHTTLASIKEIERLVKAGAIAIGRKPVRVSSLIGYPNSDAIFHQLAGKVWGNIDGKKITENHYGKGKMIYGQTLEHVLNKLLPPDFDYSVSSKADTLNYIHRKTNDADFYFVASVNKQHTVDAVARFRVTGKAPELWDPSTGKMTEPATFRVVNGITEVPIHFDPAGSTFVVFRKAGIPKTFWDGMIIIPASDKVMLTVEEPWTIRFPSGKQAPERIILDKLISWTDHPSDGVKYFSGTATYSTTFNWTKSASAASPLILDLGKVRNLAVVKLNGKTLGTLWKPPYSMAVSDALVEGKNELEIEITNLWANRLIGDEKFHPDTTYQYGRGRLTTLGSMKSIPEWVQNGGKSPVGRTTYIPYWFYDGTEPLFESGLIGPVRLVY